MKNIFFNFTFIHRMATNRPWIKMEIGRLQPSIDVISSDVILRHNHVIGHVIRANQCHSLCMVAEVKLIPANYDLFVKCQISPQKSQNSQIFRNVK